MRRIDANTLNALSGSRSGEGITVFVWYGSRLAYPGPLPVASWGFSWDRTRQIQTFDMTVADKEGRLAPWLLEDPLGVGGSRLQVRYNVGGAGSINIGWYRITGAAPAERWHSYRIDDAGRVNADSSVPAGKKDVLISGGATIQIQADDLGAMIAADRLLAPESPQGTNPTVVGEIRRLAGDIVPVVTSPGVVDRPVNKTLIYERERLDAIQSLCKSVACDYRMNGDGQLEIYPLAAQAPVATLQGGPEGLLVRVDREQKYDGLFNRFVVTGTGTDTPVRAISEITAGPLSVNGPHGRVPTFYESNMISTQTQAYDYSRTMKDTLLAGLTVELKVTCLPVPHVQQGDWVQVGNPVAGGQPFILAGMVKAINQPSNGTVPGPCTVTVECSYSDVQIALGGVDRG